MKNKIDFQEFQSIAKGVLKQLDAFCQENNLTYFLTFGTLIGAIRHKDIIPWDYDIDICMPRPDFEKFLKLTANGQIADNLSVFTWNNCRNYYLPFIKVCDNRTRLVITKTKNPHIPLGIWVDIFPLDGASDTMAENQSMQKSARSLIYKAKMPLVKTTNIKESLYQIPTIIRSWFVPPCKYTKEAVQIAATYDYDTAKMVGITNSLDLDVSRELAPKELYKPLRVPFGDFEVTVPAGYDTILTQLYGDYMTPPPEKDRELPNIGAYWVK